MKNEFFPFHYEVNFRLISYKNNEDLKINSFPKKFQSDNPFMDRREVFEEFEEYLSYLKLLERVELVNGNFQITKPTLIQDILEKNETQTIEDYYSKFRNFQQEISIYLVISDVELARKIHEIDYNESNEFSVKLDGLNEIEQDFVIHKISTNLGVVEEQEIVDNLALTELKLYEYFNIDITKYKKEVFHFGLDYSESGEEQDGCERTILETPHVWSSEERYEKEFLQDTEFESQKENSNILSWEKMIENGEGHQVEFKPALRYHFKHKKETNSVRKIIAHCICAFLNSSGGILFIGVSDNGEIQGLEQGDYKLFDNNKRDKFRNEFDIFLSHFFRSFAKPFITLTIESIHDKDVGVVQIQKSESPIFLRTNNYGEINKEFYFRGEASSRKIDDVEEIIQYVFNNWKK